jgi:hypothetical protein
MIEWMPLPGFNWWCIMDNYQSDFNEALTQILKLTQDTCDEFGTTQMDTVAWYLCRGKLMALNQVIGFFTTFHTKALAARAGSWARY